VSSEICPRLMNKANALRSRGVCPPHVLAILFRCRFFALFLAPVLDLSCLFSELISAASPYPIAAFPDDTV
jgi:hypothetical protein